MQEWIINVTLFAASMFAPADRSSCTTSLSPICTAHKRGVLPSYKVEKESEQWSVKRTTVTNEARSNNPNEVNICQPLSAWQIFVCLFELLISTRQNTIIRTSKYISLPCNNESSILPYLPPLCSPRRTEAAAPHPHVHKMQPTREASIRPKI